MDGMQLVPMDYFKKECIICYELIKRGSEFTCPQCTQECCAECFEQIKKMPRVRCPYC